MKNLFAQVMTTLAIFLAIVSVSGFTEGMFGFGGFLIREAIFCSTAIYFATVVTGGCIDE